MRARSDHNNGFDPTRFLIWGSDYLLAACAIADGVTFLYALHVLSEVQYLGNLTLGFLCVGVGGAAFLARQVVVDAFRSPWKLKLWVIAIMYSLCAVAVVSWLIHSDPLDVWPTWPIEHVWSWHWGLEESDPGVVQVGHRAGGVLYCIILIALGVVHVAYWYSLRVVDRPRADHPLETPSVEAPDQVESSL